MTVSGFFSFSAGHGGVEACLRTPNATWVARYTSLENAMTVALLTKLLGADEVNTLTRMPFDKVLTTEHVCISPLSLTRAGFTVAKDFKVARHPERFPPVLKAS